ncbi:hypothetical protein KM043_014830 [Ampulex compressa]|nr:hypothetical protein KM043_014830 [Ampulex compressa]
MRGNGIDLGNYRSIRFDAIAIFRDNEWSTEACEKFAELTWLGESKVLVAKVRGYKERAFSYGKSRREGSPIPCVELYDTNDNKDINIGQELINDGTAESDEGPWSAASSTLSLSRRSHDVPTFSSPAPTPPPTRRGESPETPANTPARQILIPETPMSSPLHKKIVDIDLTTPRRGDRPIEEIDLVTPVKDETRRFIDNEKKLFRENGSGDQVRNGSAGQEQKRPYENLKVDKFANVAPGGYESDLSVDSDELEMG